MSPHFLQNRLPCICRTLPLDVIMASTWFALCHSCVRGTKVLACESGETDVRLQVESMQVSAYDVCYEVVWFGGAVNRA